METIELVKKVVESLEDKKAEDITVIDNIKIVTNNNNKIKQ